jgi:hypothetical protein
MVSAGFEPANLGTRGQHATGIRSPDRPARSQSLYRLTNPAHLQGKSKGKVHPRTGHEGPEGE